MSEGALTRGWLREEGGWRRALPPRLGALCLHEEPAWMAAPTRALPRVWCMNGMAYCALPYAALGVRGPRL